MTNAFAKFYLGLIAIGRFLQAFFLLGVRLFWGWQFFQSGLGKYHDIHSIIEFFKTLGIPAPAFNAYLASTTELVGGLCLIVGFASRLISIPLAIVMIVALSTADMAATLAIYDDPVSFIKSTPFTFLMAALIVFCFGPGPISIDYLIQRALGYDDKNKN